MESASGPRRITTADIRRSFQVTGPGNRGVRIGLKPLMIPLISRCHWRIWKHVPGKSVQRRKNDSDNSPEERPIVIDVKNLMMIQKVPIAISKRSTVNKMLMDSQSVNSAYLQAKNRTSMPYGASAEHLPFGDMLQKRQRIEEDKLCREEEKQNNTRFRS